MGIRKPLRAALVCAAAALAAGAGFTLDLPATEVRHGAAAA